MSHATPELAATPALANSRAQQRPARPVPTLACDAHLHIYGPSWREVPGLSGPADVPAYRQVQALLGMTRAVIVQPRPYGTDNRITLQAIADLGLAHTRGIAVVAADIDDASLQQLHDGGIRGVRYSLHAPNPALGGIESLPRLAARLHELGWHVQLHCTAEQIVAHCDLIAGLPGTVVFDHRARLPAGANHRHAAFAIVRERIDSGGAWVKLSGVYLDSNVGAAGAYADLDVQARDWVRAAPERLVWGSDWPHVTEATDKPDDTQLLDLLGNWCSDDALRQRILVDNPAQLYGFAASPRATLASTDGAACDPGGT